jgi:hypothetical protein
MVLYSLNLCIVYTRGVKKSVGRIVKTGVVNLSLRPPRCSDEARDNKGENDTQHREGEGESGRFLLYIGASDILPQAHSNKSTAFTPREY